MPNSCRSEENPCHLLVARTPNFVRFLIFVQSSKEFDFILLTEMTYAFYLLALVVRNNIYLYPRMAQFIVIQYFLYFVRFDYLAPHMAVLWEEVTSSTLFIVRNTFFHTETGRWNWLSRIDRVFSQCHVSSDEHHFMNSLSRTRKDDFTRGTF